MEWLGKTEARGTQPCPRKGHTLTRLLDSSLILVFGGESSSGKLLNDMYSLHVERMEWKRIIYKQGPVPSPRLLHTATAISSTAIVVMFGDALVHTGDQSGGTSPLSDVWVFDIRDFSWKEVPHRGNAPPARSCHTAVFGKGLGQVPALYVFGGFEGGASCGSAVLRLRIGDWEWENLPVLLKDAKGNEFVTEDPGIATNVTEFATNDDSFPKPRESHGAVWLPGLNGMLVVGGDGGGSLLDDCWLLVPTSRRNGVWRWRKLKLRTARQLPKNKLPPCAGFSLIPLPTERTQVLVWGGICGAGDGQTMTPKYSYLIDLDAKQTTCLVAKGEAPTAGRLLHGFVRANDHLIAFGGCDGSGNVMTGLEMAKLFPDFKSVGLHATDFGPVAADVAAGSHNRAVNDDEMQSKEDLYGHEEETNIPLVGPSTIPKGTPLSGRILDVSDYGYFVSVVIKGRLYKGVLVANPLKNSIPNGQKNGNDFKGTLKDATGDAEDSDGRSAAPEHKRPRLDPAAEALPDSPRRPVKAGGDEVIDVD